MKSQIYWAWWDNEEETFRYIYRIRAVVEMCSPDKFESAEENGEGRIVQIKIEEQKGN